MTDQIKSLAVPLLIFVFLVIFILLFRKQIVTVLIAAAQSVGRSESFKAAGIEMKFLPAEQKEALAESVSSGAAQPSAAPAIGTSSAPTLGQADNEAAQAELKRAAGAAAASPDAERYYEMFRHQLLYRLSSPSQVDFVRDLALGKASDDASVDAHFVASGLPATEKADWLRWLTDVTGFVTVETVASTKFYRLTDEGARFVDDVANVARERNRYIRARTIAELGPG